MAANEHVDMATSGADRTADRLSAVPGIRRAPSPKLQQFMLTRFLDADTCAALMALLLTPSIISGLFLTLPPLLFQSPQQNAYFYFANVLEHDPSRWLLMGFAVLCILLALAIPASMPRQRVSVSY